MLYDYRGRIGLMCVAPGAAPDMDFHRTAPAGIAVLTTRLPLASSTIAAHLELERLAMDCAVLLAQAKPSVIVYGDTTGSFINGIGYDKELIKRIEDLTGCPATTTSTSVLKALKAYGAKRLTVITPYLEEINERERSFLEDNDFRVSSVKGFNLRDPFQIAHVEPEDVRQLARASFAPGDDALFISCAGLTVLDIIEPLEEELGVPVLSSNQCAIWGALRLIGVNDKIAGCGRLLRET